MIANDTILMFFSVIIEEKRTPVQMIGEKHQKVEENQNVSNKNNRQPPLPHGFERLRR